MRWFSVMKNKTSIIDKISEYLSKEILVLPSRDIDMTPHAAFKRLLMNFLKINADPGYFKRVFGEDFLIIDVKLFMKHQQEVFNYNIKGWNEINGIGDEATKPDYWKPGITKIMNAVEKDKKKLHTEYKNGLLQAINVIRKTLFDVIEATDGASVASIQRMVAELVNEMTRITKLNTEQFWNLMESSRQERHSHNTTQGGNNVGIIFNERQITRKFKALIGHDSLDILFASEVVEKILNSFKEESRVFNEWIVAPEMYDIEMETYKFIPSYHNKPNIKSGKSFISTSPKKKTSKVKSNRKRGILERAELMFDSAVKEIKGITRNLSGITDLMVEEIDYEFNKTDKEAAYFGYNGRPETGLRWLEDELDKLLRAYSKARKTGAETPMIKRGAVITLPTDITHPAILKAIEDSSWANNLLLFENKSFPSITITAEGKIAEGEMEAASATEITPASDEEQQRGAGYYPSLENYIDSQDIDAQDEIRQYKYKIDFVHELVFSSNAQGLKRMVTVREDGSRSTWKAGWMIQFTIPMVNPNTNERQEVPMSKQQLNRMVNNVLNGYDD